MIPKTNTEPPACMDGGPTITWTPTEAGQQSHKTTITIDELLEQEQALGGPADRDSVLNALDDILPDIHRNGSELHAACPECGHTRNPNAKGKSDRFFSTARTNYQFWTCRQCEYKTTTNTLLGIAPGTLRPQRPIVKPWDEQPHDAQTIEWTREAYANLTEFSQRYLDRAMDYLNERGVSPEVAELQGLGYIDKSLYIGWYRGLTPELKAGVEFGGLPEVKENGRLGSGWSMVSGHQGKIVFPYRDQDGVVCDIRTRSISDRDTANGKPVRYMGPRGGYAERGAQLPYISQTDSSTVILSEGEFKSLVPLSKGCLYPVYTLRGTSDPIIDMLDHFHGKTVILAFDNDEAGRLATVKQGRILRAKGIGVLVLNPSEFGRHEAIDDFVLTEGIDTLNNLLTPANLLTLPEYEKTLDPELIDKLSTPKTDVGTVRRWTPESHVDQFAHPTINDSISLDGATDLIKQKVAEHVQGWRKGNGQLLIGSPAGVGKTTATMDTVAEIIETEHGTVSVFMPNHSQIDEKIEEGLLEDFQHIYGRRWDNEEDGVRNCQQAETASTLTQLGYDVSAILCPSCEFTNWCRAEGYKSQFSGKANRAYVHNHVFTSYPEGSDVAIIDEANHKTFIQDTRIYGGHLQRALAEGIDNQAQRELLESLLMLFTMPNIETLTGIEFYSALQHHYPELIAALAQWGDGAAVQQSLFDMVLNCTQSDDRNVYEVEQLPPAFAQALFSTLNEDVRRLAQGELPTGRIKLVNAGSHRYIETVSSKELPDWYYNTPTILLNATANETISQELWGIEGQLDVVSPEVAMMDGNEVIQDITLNNAKSGLMGNGEVAQSQRAAWIERIRDHIGIHDPSDVVLITVKPLADYLKEAFPDARVAWYGALEGRNDLQAGITILCNPPAINLPAIQDEARALWPGIDTTLTRKSISYNDIQNEAGHYLAIEQVDAVDPRLSALIDQHRDALAIQAIGRARLVRNSGRRVVVMFSRPIPGITPTEVIHTRQQRNEYKKNKTLEKLIGIAGEMLEERASFSVSTLAERAGSARRTVHKYWQEIIDALGVQWVDLPCVQPLSNGGWQSIRVRLAMNEEGRQALKIQLENARIYGRSQRYNTTIIANGSTVDLAIPDGFQIDVDKLPKPAHTDIEEAQPAPAPEQRPVVLPDSDYTTVTDSASELLFIIPGIGIARTADYVPPPTLPPPMPVSRPAQVARSIFPSSEVALEYAEMIKRGGLYNVVLNGCTVDMKHKYGFDLAHLADERTEIIEMAV